MCFEGKINVSVQIFGHKSPDTDSTGSPIIWAWYLNEIKGIPAEAKLLGEPNTEAAFVLKRWNLQKPTLLGELTSNICLLYTSPSPRDQRGSRMPSSA